MASNEEILPGPGTAPILRLTLECPTKISRDSEEKYLKFNVTYEGTSDTNAEDAPPITFHKYGVMGEEKLSLYQLRNGEWTECLTEQDEYGGCSGFALLDAPPLLVKVGEDEQFLSLGRGESVVAHQRTIPKKFPEDAKPGDRFRVGLRGAHVEWWNWGGRQSHANTEVYLPCWRVGRVVNPPTPDYDSILCPETKNDGRPKMVLHVSDPVEFTLA
ncbi:uncharacterized protein JN550_006326 [Neoarthrinium moseri]|uniref:uncharacterized protein n=1 Tax=Neoarthrinium moseri TaxID=1658444 RepID=UPI001FDB5223|nr:uncharacterized protein JN550_006326 [Neoarthrinium moseri]KAI1868410.1 hypothetical protein JN550_006326 [Neoarthrinium moseri]